jgi:hypothetical protein
VAPIKRAGKCILRADAAHCPRESGAQRIHTGGAGGVHTERFGPTAAQGLMRPCSFVIPPARAPVSSGGPLYEAT